MGRPQAARGLASVQKTASGGSGNTVRGARRRGGRSASAIAAEAPHRSPGSGRPIAQAQHRDARPVV